MNSTDPLQARLAESRKAKLKQMYEEGSVIIKRADPKTNHEAMCMFVALVNDLVPLLIPDHMRLATRLVADIVDLDIASDALSSLDGERSVPASIPQTTESGNENDHTD